MQFLAPQRLWWLALVGLLLAAYVLLNARTSSGPKSPKSSINRVLPKDSPLKRHLSVIAAALAMASLVIAWAQPTAVRQVPREKATIVLAIDVSLSMRAQDISPSRIDVAKQAAVDFLGIVPADFMISLVLFGGDVTVKTVPSTDRAAVAAAIQGARLIPQTAIGLGIETALEMTGDGPAAIVLLSDGYTNAGPPSAQAAEKARDKGVPIYTIALGTPDGSLIDRGQRRAVPVNHAELMNIAKISGGEKYAAESAAGLHNVYQTLGHQLGYIEQRAEVTERYAGLALLCGLVAALGIISLAARWP